MARLFAAGSLAVAASVIAQVQALAWSNATCVSEFWSFNTRQQSPCLVSAYLSVPCSTTGNWGVYDVGSKGGPYVLPARSVNTCLCNSVQWNLLSACSMCQGGSAGSWGAWVAYCSKSITTIGGYPLGIPAGTAVPHWAYYDFTTTGVFNSAIASQQSGPESSALVASPTSTSASQTGSSTTARSATATSNSSANSNSSQSSSNTGAIVGGVVGGVLGLALISLLAFVIVRKNGQRKTSQYGPGGYNPPAGSQPNSEAPIMSQHQHGVQRPGMMPPSGSDHVYKPYNPDDPSTFPAELNNTTVPSAHTESLTYTNQSHTHAGQYNSTSRI